MNEDKSSSGEQMPGGVGGDMREGGGNDPHQGHLFFNTEVLWKIIGGKKEQFWNEQNQLFEDFITYVHTQPLNWRGPAISDKLPWED